MDRNLGQTLRDAIATTSTRIRRRRRRCWQDDLFRGVSRVKTMQVADGPEAALRWAYSTIEALATTYGYDHPAPGSMRAVAAAMARDAHVPDEAERLAAGAAETLTRHPQPDSVFLRMALAIEADCLYKRGDLDRAASRLQTQVELERTAHVDVQPDVALAHLAQVQLDQGDLDGARDTAWEAVLESARRRRGSDPLVVGTTARIAEALLSERDPGAALSLAQHLLNSVPTSEGASHPARLVSTVVVARCELTIGAAHQAVDRLQDVLNDVHRDTPSNVVRAIDYWLAMASWSAGDPTTARHHLERLARTAHGHPDQSDIGEQLWRSLAVLRLLDDDEAAALVAFQELDRQLENSLRRAIDEDGDLRGVVLGQRRDLATLVEAAITHDGPIGELAVKAVLRSKGLVVEAHGTRHIRARRRKYTTTRSADLDEGPSPLLDIDPAAIARALEPDEVLLEIVQLPIRRLVDGPGTSLEGFADQRRSRSGEESGEYAVIVLTRDEPPFIERLGKVEFVDELVHACVGELQRAESSWPTRAAVALAEPFLRLLTRPGQTRFLIAPDGELHRLPLGALPAGDDRLLVDHTTFAYITSARDVIDRGRPSADSGPPLVVADPDFDLGLEDPGRAQLTFERLAGTRREGERVATLYGVEAHLGAEADAMALRAPRDSPVIIHLATHGFVRPDPRPPAHRSHFDSAQFTDVGGELYLTDLAPAWKDRQPPDEMLELLGLDENDPLQRSGVVFAGVNAPLRTDGRPRGQLGNAVMTAADVIDLGLTGTEVVVLSACETGLGVAERGEGVLGMRRAFQLAGARTLVATLWQIDDEATVELATVYHQALRCGVDRVVALHDAQRHVRSNPATEHPYFWAAFVSIGARGPVPMRQFNR